MSNDLPLLSVVKWPISSSSVPNDSVGIVLDLFSDMDAKDSSRTVSKERYSSTTNSNLPAKVRFAHDNHERNNYNGYAPMSHRIQKYQNQPEMSANGVSNKVVPDTKREEYMWHKKLEQASIAHQTYRTLPIVSPKPKARHDLVTTVSYMNYNMDPTWNLCAGSRASQRSSSNSGTKPTIEVETDRRLERERKLNAAMLGSVHDTSPTTGVGVNHQAHHCCCCNNLRREEELMGTEQSSNSMPAFDYRRYIELTRGKAN